MEPIFNRLRDHLHDEARHAIFFRAVWLSCCPSYPSLKNFHRPCLVRHSRDILPARSRLSRSSVWSKLISMFPGFSEGIGGASCSWIGWRRCQRAQWTAATKNTGYLGVAPDRLCRSVVTDVVCRGWPVGGGHLVANGHLYHWYDDCPSRRYDLCAGLVSSIRRRSRCAQQYSAVRHWWRGQCSCSDDRCRSAVQSGCGIHCHCGWLVKRSVQKKVVEPILRS